MSVDELRSGSTYPFADDPSAVHGIGTYEIVTPYDLVVQTGGARVVIEDVGMEYQGAFIIVRDGRVTNFVGPVQSELLTLDEAIERARDLSEQLVNAGFSGSQGRFYVQSMLRGVPRPTISSLEDAHVALVDPNLRIAEMTVFIGETPQSTASLTIASGSRQRQLHSTPGDSPNPVGQAIEAARMGREWTLQLEVGAPLPTVR